MVVRQTLGTENGRHEIWSACTNPAETHFFGLPHREKDWEYTEFVAEDPQLEPWPNDEPLNGMVAGQARRVTFDQLRIYIAEAIPAAVIAASLVAAILISLLSGTTPAA